MDVIDENPPNMPLGQWGRGHWHLE